MKAMNRESFTNNHFGRKENYGEKNTRGGRGVGGYKYKGGRGIGI